MAFSAALVCSIVIADAPHPPGVFPKYFEAVRAPAAVQAERFLDYSPLYLALVRLLAPFGNQSLLWVQCVMHALTAAAIALSVGTLVSRGWAVMAGLAAASYRPFLVYSAIEEPELALAACLSVGIWLGISVRQRVSAGGRGASLWFGVAGTVAAISAAGVLRPQYLLLVPVWGYWVASAGARSVRSRIWAVTGGVGAVIVFPVLLSRSLAAGFPVIMNPGPVFYEGNGPAATGLARHAPEIVRLLEQVHPEAIDYGHVAYRRIASAATGRDLGPAATNRFWTRLALEGLTGFPAPFARRLARKSLMAVMPYEGHDLIVSEDLDRRTRRLIPWGFGVLLIVVPMIVLASRSDRAALAGPLSIAALSLLVQIVFYAQARQRLPMALSLLVVAPVVLAAWWRERLRIPIRRSISFTLGLGFAALIGFLTGPVAISDQLNWDRAIGPAQPSLGETLARIFDGRLLARYEGEDAERFVGSVDLMRAGRAREAASLIEPLTGRRRDFTVAEGTIGVPEYWLAVAQLKLGRKDLALESAKAAERTRPGEPRISALRLRLERRQGTETRDSSWRPPGCDRIDALWALAAAAAADGDPQDARRIAEPVWTALPDLTTKPIRAY